MQSKIGIDFEKVRHARATAKDIADEVQAFVNNYTTVAVERTLCRLIGIDGVDENAVPLPNVLVDELKGKEALHNGALFYIGNAMIETGKTPQEIAENMACEGLDITAFPFYSVEKVAETLQPHIEKSIEKSPRTAGDGRNISTRWAKAASPICM